MAVRPDTAPGRTNRCCSCSCAMASGVSMPIRAPWTWMGVTPHFGTPQSAAGRMEPDSPTLPAATGHSQPAVRPGKGLSAASQRHSSRWPTGWPSLGCSGSPTETGANRTGSPIGLPARDRCFGATPAEGWLAVHIPTLPDATTGIEKGGSLRSRSPVPARRSRPGGRDATESRTTTYAVAEVHV